MKYQLYLILITIFIQSCEKENKLKTDLNNLIAEWDYVLPLPSDNDSINLLFLQIEKNWYQYNHKISDSLCNKILAIDSTFHHALAFKAWDPLDLDLLDKAMNYAKNDTTIHRTVLEADYAYWINKDTATAIRKFKEAFDMYPNSKTMSWCLGMSYLWAGQNDKAIHYYKHSLSIDSLFPKSYEMIGWAYYMKEDYNRAIKNFKISMNFGNNDMYTYRYTGKAYENIDNVGKAKYYYNIADSLENK